MFDEFNNALKDFNKLVEMEPDDTSTLIARAAVYLNLGQYEDALTDLNNNKLLKHKPFDTMAQHLRGYAYLMLEKYNLALDDFDKSLGIDPSITFTLYGNALSNLNKLLDTKPDNDIKRLIIQPGK